MFGIALPGDNSRDRVNSRPPQLPLGLAHSYLSL